MIRSLQDDKNRSEYIDAFFEADSALKILRSKIDLLRKQRANDTTAINTLQLDITEGKNREKNQQDQLQKKDLIIDYCNQEIKQLNGNLLWWKGGTVAGIITTIICISTK